MISICLQLGRRRTQSANGLVLRNGYLMVDIRHHAAIRFAYFLDEQKKLGVLMSHVQSVEGEHGELSTARSCRERVYVFKATAMSY